MRIGSLVHVLQVRGCHTPPQKTDMGLGVVLAIHESEPLKIKGMEFDTGKDATVKLASGEVKRLHHSDFNVVA